MNALTKIENKPLREAKSPAEMLLNKHALDQIGKVAAFGVRPEQLTRHVLDCLHQTPKLAETDPRSMLSALMNCAEMGLTPNTPLGQAYLIPFGRECQLVVGYRGLMTLALRSGDVKSIQSGVATVEEVKAGDFDWQHGSTSFLKAKGTYPDGEPAYAWAYAKMESGGEQFIVMPWAKVLEIRDGSNGWKSAVKFGKTKSSPWFTNEREMGEKTAIRALCKKLPLGAQAENVMNMAMTADDTRAVRSDVGFGSGPIIDMDADEEEKPAEGPKPDPKPEAKKADPKPKEEPKAEAMPPHLQSLIERIVGDLADANRPDHIDVILGMFEAEIGNGKAESPAFAKEIGEQIAEFRKAVA